ncbi:MAG TPA: TIGR03085 family metal-binding protein [Acidimicrobiales bacterium]|nr:TIGR03085 family metal-binding protein [Acidimicrobiales bacterium]
MAIAPHRSERTALCDLLTRVGPAAPTLCSGWTTTDLATHLVVRERKPLAALGLVLPGPFAAGLAKTMKRMSTSESYDGLVALVRRGPPSLLRPFDTAMNMGEYFIHHEDVRRGSGDTTPRPMADIAVVEEALWRSVGRGARLMTRSLGPTGLDLIHVDGRVVHARRGEHTATLTGRPGEIVLYLWGRGDAAHVELGGPSEAVAAVRNARFGI